MTAADTTPEKVPKPEESPSTRFGAGAAQVAAWGFVFLLLRIFAVSNYDWDTAFLVSTTLGLDDGLALLFGTLMAGHLLTSLLLVVVVPVLVTGQVWGPREHRPVAVLLTIVGLVLILTLTLSFRSWWLPLATSVVLVALALTRRLSERNRLRRASVHALTRASGVAGGAVLAVAAFVSTPWVPQETIETTDGIIIGHVLSVDSGYLNVLDDEHEFVIIVSTDVLARR